jgi:hypothetical protein
MLSNFRFGRISVSTRLLGIALLAATVFAAGCTTSGGSAQFAVTTTSGQLATVVINAAYPSTTLAASNGIAPYTWAWSGNTPPGMSLSSTGVLSGTPTSFGTFSFTVTATDSAVPPHTATTNLTVMINPALSSVSLNPATVTGGTSSAGTVTLNGAAAAAATVTLSSSNGAATVPATATVAAGQTTGTFTVATSGVSASTSAIITATFGVAKTATLAVNAPTVQAPLTLALSTLTGGAGTTGTVTLTGPAAAGGDSVTLSSDNAAAQVPATVLVAAGQTSAQFNVTSSVVGSNATAHILASFNSSSQSATLTVVPAPAITSFIAAAATITSGASTTLTGVFSNGTGSVSNGVGTVTSGTVATVSPTTTTTYTLTVTNAAGTSVTRQATVTVVAAPTITSFTPAAATITAGTSTTLTGIFAGGTGSVDNSVGAVTTGTPVTVSPAATTTYTLTVTNAANITATKQVTVTVVPAPVATSFVSAAATITAGTSTTLTGVFSNGTGSIDNGVGAVTTGTPVTVSPVATTTYTLTVTNAANTTATKQVTVTVVSAPAVTSFVSAAATITAGTSTTLTGVFSNGTGSVNNGVGAVTSGTPVTVSPASTTTYTLTVTNAANATATKQITVTVVPAPSITSFTSGLATIVSGNSTTLTAVFTNGTGSIDNGVGAVTSGTPVNISPVATTTYTLTVTNTATAPATVTATTTVTVHVPPAITSANSATFTVGSNGTFTVRTTGNPTASLNAVGTLPGTVTFHDNSDGTATISGTPTGSPASYPITITASNGVSPNAVQTFTLNVVLVQAPAITSGNNVTFTIGSNGSFTVNTTGSPNAALSKTGALPSAVNFTDNGNGTATISGTPGVGTAGNYPITITANNGVNPNAQQTFTLSVVAAPVITSFTATAPTITTGTSTTLTAVFSGGTASVNNGVGVVTSGTPVTVSPGSTTTYTLTVTNAATTPASVTSTTMVTVVAAPIITSFTATSATIISGTSTTLTPVFSNGNGSVDNGIGAVTSGTGFSVSPTVTTTYTLTVTNTAGSKTTSTVQIIVHAPPTITSLNNTTFTVGVNGNFKVMTTGNPTPTLTHTGTLPSPLTFVDNGDGTATISGTPAGPSVTSFNITASNGIGSDATQSFTLNVTAVSCSSNCTISGTVTGPWVSGVTIALSGTGTGSTTTDPSGNYSFTGLTGGSYTLTPSLAGYTYSPSAPVVSTSASPATQNFAATSVITSHSISGMVSYPTGAQTGKTLNTIIRVFNSGCTSCGGSNAGTSISSVPAAGGTAYTVRGLSSGSYVVTAEIDTQLTGVPNSSNPNGISSTATISTSDVTGVNITVADRTPLAPSAPSTPNIFPSSGAVLVVYNEVDDTNGEELATSYKLSYGTDTSATSLGTKSYPAGNSEDVFAVTGLTNGTAYYFKLAAVNATGTSAYSSVVGPITINATSGSNTVSGTITFTGITPAVGAHLNVGLFSGNSGVYFVSYTSPTSGQTFSISGVPSGKYSLFAFLDQQNCNYICVGDVTNFVGPNGPPQIVISGPSSGNVIALTAFNANTYVSTYHTSGNGNPDSYGVNVGINLGAELPISMTLYSAPNVGVPYDLNADPQNSNSPINNNSVSPNVGDVYKFQVTFANGVTQVIPASVTEVLNTFATSLSETTSGVVGGVTLSRNVPEFTWAAPSAPPSFYTYQIQVYQNNQQIWNYKGGSDSNGLPSTITSAVFNSDGRASQASLTTGVKYAFSVSVTDNLGNTASFVVSYTP